MSVGSFVSVRQLGGRFAHAVAGTRFGHVVGGTGRVPETVVAARGALPCCASAVQGGIRSRDIGGAARRWLIQQRPPLLISLGGRPVLVERGIAGKGASVCSARSTISRGDRARPRRCRAIIGPPRSLRETRVRRAPSTCFWSTGPRDHGPPPTSGLEATADWRAQASAALLGATAAQSRPAAPCGGAVDGTGGAIMNSRRKTHFCSGGGNAPVDEEQKTLQNVGDQAPGPSPAEDHRA